MARKSDEVETAINEKLTDVGDLTEKLVFFLFFINVNKAAFSCILLPLLS